MLDAKLREMLTRAGYTVHQRNSHVGTKWDYSAPWKGPMESRILETPEQAWAEAYTDFQADLERARAILAAEGSRFEPDTAHMDPRPDDVTSLRSIAISLKRIADAMTAPAGEVPSLAATLEISCGADLDALANALRPIGVHFSRRPDEADAEFRARIKTARLLPR